MLAHNACDSCATACTQRLRHTVQHLHTPPATRCAYAHTRRVNACTRRLQPINTMCSYSLTTYLCSHAMSATHDARTRNACVAHKVCNSVPYTVSVLVHTVSTFAHNACGNLCLTSRLRLRSTPDVPIFAHSNQHHTSGARITSYGCVTNNVEGTVPSISFANWAL